MRNSLPSLAIGEKIKYFDLISTDGNKIDLTNLNNKGPSVICIFSRPCSPCDPNIEIWRSIKSILKDKVKIYGIAITDLSEAKELLEKKYVNFKLYIPLDKDKFIKDFHIRSDYSQTILYDNEVRALYFGTLAPVDVKYLINVIKSYNMT